MLVLRGETEATAQLSLIKSTAHHHGDPAVYVVCLADRQKKKLNHLLLLSSAVMFLQDFKHIVRFKDGSQLFSAG